MLLTAAEILVSITCLEFSYTQAPPSLKSWIMAAYLCSVSAGNAFTALVNALWPPTATDVQYYEFFAVLMLVTSVAFLPVVFCYQERSYMPTVSPAPEQAATGVPAAATPKQTELAADDPRPKMR